MLTWTAIQALTGEHITDLPGLDVASVSHVLGRYDTTTASLPIPSAPVEWERATRHGYAALILCEDDAPIWGGLVTKRDRSAADTVALSLATAEVYLDRRKVGDVTYTQVGQNTIAADLVARFAADGAIPGLPIRVEIVGDAPGTLRDHKWERTDNKTVYSVLSDLAGIVGGIEWTMSVERTAGGFGWVLTVGDRIGYASTEPVAVFNLPGDVTEFEMSESYTDGEGANRVTAVSSGQGSVRPTSPPQVGGEDGRPTFEFEFTPATSIHNPLELTGHAQGRLAQMADGATALSLTSIVGIGPAMGVAWALGDDVGYAIEAPSVGFLAGVARAVGWARTLTGVQKITPILDLTATPLDPYINTRLSTVNMSGALSWARWRQGRTRALTAQGRAHITTFLDSITAGAGTGYPERVNSWPGQLHRMLDERVPGLGSGLMPVHDAGGFDDRMTQYDATWVSGGGVLGLGLMCLTGTARLILAETWCDAVDIWVARSPGSTGRLLIDGVDAGLIDLDEPRDPVAGTFPALPIRGAASDILRVQCALGVAPGMHMVEIQPATPTDVVYPAMIETYLWAMPGFRVSNMARGGASMANMVSDVADGTGGMALSIDAARADLLILMPGINDYQGHVTLADFRARMVTVIERQLRIGSLLLVTPPQPNYAEIPADHFTDPPLSAYRDVLLELVDGYRLPLVDLHTRWGQWSDWSAQGWASDNVHLSAAGAIEAATVILTALDTI